VTATQFLALNTNDGVTPQVKTVADNVFTNVGVTFGTLDTNSGGLASGGANGAFNPVNRVVNFGGNEKTFLAAAGTAIFRTTDEFASFSSVQTLTSLTGTTIYKTGIHIVDVNGTPTATILYVVSVNTARAMTSTDGVTWVDSGTSGTLHTWNGASTSQAILDEIVYHNVLYFYGSQQNGGTNCLIWYYEPGTNAFGSFDPGSNLNGGTLCVWQDMLVLLRANSSAVIEVANLTTTEDTVIVPSITTGASSAVTASRFGAFVEPSTNNLIVFFYATGPGGTMQCYTITPSFVATRLTTTVLPAALQALGNTAKVRPYVDVQGNVGGNPTVYVYFGANGTSGTTYAMYQWNGDSSLMTLIGSGGNVRHALGINTHPVGGQYNYTSGNYRIRLTGRAPAASAMRYTFKIYSTSGTDAVKVQGVFGLGTEEKLTRAATLSSPSVGTISGGFNTGLTADGTTAYQVTWNAATDGLTQGQRHKFVFNVVAS
jgi:hypothetical protein